MIEMTWEEYKALGLPMEYDWIAAFMGGNPTWTLDKLFETPKWRQGDSRYEVYKIRHDNGLVFRTVVRKSDNAEVFREFPHDARGGYRPGSGRKAKSESGKAVTVSFSCFPEQKEQLQKDVAESGMGQSEYILSKLF